MIGRNLTPAPDTRAVTGRCYSSSNGVVLFASEAEEIAGAETRIGWLINEAKTHYILFPQNPFIRDLSVQKYFRRTGSDLFPSLIADLVHFIDRVEIGASASRNYSIFDSVDFFTIAKTWWQRQVFAEFHFDRYFQNDRGTLPHISERTVRTRKQEYFSFLARLFPFAWSQEFMRRSIGNQQWPIQKKQLTVENCNEDRRNREKCVEEYLRRNNIPDQTQRIIGVVGALSCIVGSWLAAWGIGSWCGVLRERNRGLCVLLFIVGLTVAIVGQALGILLNLYFGVCGA